MKYIVNDITVEIIKPQEITSLEDAKKKTAAFIYKIAEIQMRTQTQIERA